MRKLFGTVKWSGWSSACVMCSPIFARRLGWSFVNSSAKADVSLQHCLTGSEHYRRPGLMLAHLMLHMNSVQDDVFPPGSFCWRLSLHCSVSSATLLRTASKWLPKWSLAYLLCYLVLGPLSLSFQSYFLFCFNPSLFSQKLFCDEDYLHLDN